MATLKEMITSFKYITEEQAILMKGIHGIGKSESVKKYFEDLGYKVIVLFLGQASDAGDIIGLPDKRIVILENGESVTITDYAPPKWWPLNNEKVVIFLDEINRGKPEIMQCVMDLVLNRTLNGRALPSTARIIAAMNPSDDGYYQVEELDPALRDRFNIFDFRPSNEEWLEWASENEVNQTVIGFISRHAEMLDPPSAKEAKDGEIYPSRRSWSRVSSILNKSPELLEPTNFDILQNIMFGIVGTSAASSFRKYVREVGSGLSAEIVLNSLTKSILDTITKTWTIQETIHMNTQIVAYFKNQTAFMKNKDNKATVVLWCKHLEQYLNAINVESSAGFYGEIQRASNKGEEWCRYVMTTNKNIGTAFMDVVRGK